MLKENVVLTNLITEEEKQRLEALCPKGNEAEFEELAFDIVSKLSRREIVLIQAVLGMVNKYADELTGKETIRSSDVKFLEDFRISNEGV